MTFANFINRAGTVYTLVAPDRDVEIPYANLKNKAAGARYYGYRAAVWRAVDPDGNVAFRADYQTTLDGHAYQSTKHSKWVATGCEAVDLLDKTIKSALKRYAKLAQDPVASRIEYRPEGEEPAGFDDYREPQSYGAECEAGVGDSEEC